MRDGQIAAIVLAAGSSSRMGLSSGSENGRKKEYQKLSCGITVLESSVRAFASVSSINLIAVTVSENSQAYARSALSPDFLTACKQEIIFVTGGKTRRESVYNALSALVPHNPCYVLIHDGARPFVSAPLIENLITSVKKYGAVIPLLPLIDTPKELGMWSEECGVWSEECGIRNEELEIKDREQIIFVKRHLKRADVGVAQTPQVFKFPEILEAHKKAACVNDEEFTDDAEIWGRFCGNVAVISGESANKKITFKEDLNTNDQ